MKFSCSCFRPVITHFVGNHVDCSHDKFYLSSFEFVVNLIVDFDTSIVKTNVADLGKPLKEEVRTEKKMWTKAEKKHRREEEK